MNSRFYINVAKKMYEKNIDLPRPTPRKLKDGGVEIPLITITCEGEEW
jgi:hypothetical protein